MRIFITLIILCLCSLCQGQSSYQFGLLPSINVSKKLKSDWKANLKLQSRQLLKEGRFDEENSLTPEYLLTDFALVFSKKIGLNNKLAGGYMARLREAGLIHRSIQQLTFVNRFSNFRLAHRVSTDQTFEAEKPITFRFRYRTTIEIPLNGASVDSQEFYFKFNNEYLNKLQSADYDLEIRLIPLLGYKLLDTNKLELGLDYRISSFLDSSSKSRFWVSMNWFVVI